MTFAKQKHIEAVRMALERYPVDQVAASPVSNIDAIKLVPHVLHTKSSLPDFDETLPKIAYVTDPSTPLLSKEECNEVIQLAQKHFDETRNGIWDLQTSGQYQVAGFYIRQIPAVQQWFLHKLKTKLFPLLAQTFPDMVESPDDLCVDNSYIFRYTPETGRRTDVHTDSGCLSFTIALNDRSEYQGGGTWFDGYGVVEMGVGHVTVRPGGVKHCGYAVESGTRYILGGFSMHRRTVEPLRMLLTFGSDRVDLVEAAVVLNPKLDSAYNILARRYEALGDTVKAQAVLEYCLEHVSSEASEVAYSLGCIYKNNEEYEKAYACMKQCLQTDKYDFDAMLGAALSASALGDTVKERSYYELIINTPGAPQKALATAYCNMGVLEKGTESEMMYYEKSLEKMPNSFSTNYCLASALAEKGKWKEAIDSFKTSVENADSDEHEARALRSLYKVVVSQIKAEGYAPKTREEAITRFENLMGKENFRKVASLTQ